MVDTPNLEITEVAAGQNQKEVTINNAINDLEVALTDTVDINVTAGDVTVTDAEGHENIFLNVINATAAVRIVTVPQFKRLFVVHSDTGNTQNVTVKRGTTSITGLTSNQSRIFYTDGTANGLIAVTAAA